MEISKFSLLILCVFSKMCLCFDLYSTPDYRAANTLPSCLAVGSSCNYVIIYTNLEPDWNLSLTAQQFPISFNGSNGL